MRDLIPCKGYIDSVGLVDQFIRHIAGKHGVIDDTISYRVGLFASIFGNRLTDRWGVEI